MVATFELDESYWGMRWVPAMPGNKSYVLEEAQKAIEILRQEIRRLRRENAQLRAGVDAAKQRQGAEEEPKPAQSPREGDRVNLKVGDCVVMTGVFTILTRAYSKEPTSTSRPV